MSHDPHHAHNPIHAVLAVAALMIIGLTLYNYTQSGKLSWSSIGIAVILFVIIAIQRGARPKRTGGSDRT